MWYTVLVFFFLCAFTYLFKKLTSTEPNKIKYNFNFFLLYFVTSVAAALFWPYFLLSPRNVRNSKLFRVYELFNRPDDVSNSLQHSWSLVQKVGIGVRFIKYTMKLCYDLEWNLRNGELLAVDRGAVIVSNHQTSLDILGMFNIWDVIDKLAAIAKKELFYVWPFGLSAYLAGVVFIDRNNAKDAYKQLHDISDVMVKKKTKLWLFPEGTRNKDYTKLLPFKKGAFNIAVIAQVPIIPVVFSPYYFINAQKYIFSKGHIVIQCLEPIPTVGLTMKDVPDLIERVHEKMSATYRELSKEVLTELPTGYPYTAKG